jgi:hypothetical protein
MMLLMHAAILRVDELSIWALRCSGQHGSEAFALAAEETGHTFGRWRETLRRTFLWRDVTSGCVVATKPRLWAAVFGKLDQLARMADVSGFDYLCERIAYLEQEVAELRTEIVARQRLRNSDHIGLRSSESIR